MNEGVNSERGFPARSSAAANVLWIASVALVYFATARFSLHFLFQPGGIASIWPPVGIYLSAILLTRPNLRPWLVGVLFVTDLIAERLAGTPLFISAIYALSNSGDAVLSSWLLLRFAGKTITFGRVREVIGFLVLSLLLSNGLWSLVAASTSGFSSGTRFFTFWKWWAISEGIGNLLVTPFLLSWAGLAKTGLGKWKLNRALEAAALFLSLAVLNYTIFRFFTTHSVFSLVHAYVTFPFLLWAALRFSTKGVTLALMILAAIALPFAAAGQDAALSPTAAHWNGLLLAQLYLAILAVPSLLLSGVVNERQQAQETLQENEKRYRLLFEADPQPLWVFDLETLDILEVNNSALRHYGYSRKEFLAMTLKDIRPPEDVPVLLERIKHHPPGTDYSGEWRHRKKDGSVINVDIYSHEITFRGRRARLVLASDITEHKRADDAQREARQLLRDVLDTVPVRVFWKDRESRYLGCNLPFAKDAGVQSPDELIGKSDHELSWHEQAEVYRADDLWVMESGLPKIGYEEPQTTPQGERLWLRTSKIPLKDAAGNISGILGTYEDITASKRSEKELRDREQFLSESQRIAHIGSWRWELSGAMHWTDETYRIFGVSPQSFTLTMESFINLIHPEDRPAMQRWIEACRAGKSPGDLEFRVVFPDGSIHFINGRGELKYDSENRPAYMAGTGQDITERKRAEEALQRSEARFRAIVETEPECVKMITQDGRVLEMNPAGLAMIEADSLGQVLGRSIFDLIVPEHREAFRALNESVCRGNPGTLEFEIVGLKGVHRWVDTHAVPFRGRPKGEACVLAITRDITERKRAEEALQDSEALLRKSQAIGHIGSWELDLVTNRLTWSNEVFRIFGLRAQEFTGNYEAFLECVHPDDRTPLDRAYSRSLREGRDTYEIEHRIIRRDTGDVRVVHEKCEHVKDAAGRVVRSVGMVQDITERKRAEDALREAKEQLALANQALEEKVRERTAELQENIADLEAFSYTIAHDMRAPLRAILGFTQLLRRELHSQASETGTQYFNQITDSARRMDRLIQDVLTLSRVTRTQLKLEPVDLEKVVHGILNCYPAFQQQQAEIRVQSPLPNVLANEAAVTLCISNLLGNAVKFVAPGVKPRIEIWAEQLKHPGKDRPSMATNGKGLPPRSMRIWFADNGIGIASDHQERIFEIFQRVDPEYEGTGIGLAIVRKAMQRMGGAVGVESEPGQGSRFWLEFSQQNREQEK